MKKLKIYIDSSVFGGCFEPEFEKYSNQLYQIFQREEAIPVVSGVVYSEIEKAPDYVQKKLFDLKGIVLATLNPEIVRLTELYLKEKIVTRKYTDDATHIAISTYHQVDVLVSWNFKHIVNLRRIHLFNGINLKEGYPMLEIRSPREVIESDKKRS